MGQRGRPAADSMFKRPQAVRGAGAARGRLMRPAVVAWLVAAILLNLEARPVAGQTVGLPRPCDAWNLTGSWGASTTRAGENRSLKVTTLRLLQRGHRLVGRWTPAEGREVTAEGTVGDGIVRLTFWTLDAPRRLILAVANDGSRIGGRWTEAGTKGGEFWASGEATCRERPQPPPPIAPGVAGALCAAWDMTGRWDVSWPDRGGLAVGPAPQAVSGWVTRLWQNDGQLIGWYEPASRVTRWPVDGDIRGRRVTLTIRLEDGLRLERTFLLRSDGRAAVGHWPVGLGGVGAELLTGRATCTALAPPS